MKSKASLFLMEQLVMVLVFALAAALCIQVFVKAGEISDETARRDEAVIIARNAAQMLKACGDPETVKEMVDSGVYTLQIQEEDSGISGLKQANIVVYYEDSPQFFLRTGWQGVGP